MCDDKYQCSQVVVMDQIPCVNISRVDELIDAIRHRKGKYFSSLYIFMMKGHHASKDG